ncbi:MAG: helix-turn-helix domain-containing protein [Solirubrobacterales bacterium]
MEIAKQFGRNLRAVRKEAGFTQDRLAAEALMDRATVSRFENGLCLPRLDHIQRLTEATGVPVGVLLEGIA